MSYYRTIKELVIETCLAEGQFPSYEKLTSLVRQHFPASKWQKTHYAWYKSKIKTGEISVPGISASGTAEDVVDRIEAEVEDSIEASVSLERDLHSYLAIAKRSDHGKLRVVMENSGGDIEYERKVFKTFGGFGRWLKSREREGGLPRRVIVPLVGCHRDLCTYNFDGGIDHNHLDLQRISYSYRKGRPRIRTIFLLAG